MKISCLIFFLLVISISIPWILKIFPMEDAETVVFTLQMPLDGFVSYFLKMALTDVLLPSVVFSVALYSVYRITKKSFFVKNLILIVLVVVSISCISFLIVEIPIHDYISILNRDERMAKPFHSSFMRQNFYLLNVDSIEFNKNKRNLILIIAESMENGFDENIPELMNLAKTNTSFQPHDYVGGGVDIVGAKNTTSATVSKITGFPLLTHHYSAIFPKIPTIYDVLHNYGYTNVFMQGTSGSFGFGGRFLESHGIDLFMDDKKIERKGIPKYNDRITDKELFGYAKLLLNDLQDTSFSLTIATIETHFPHGFYDENCIEKPIDDTDESIFRATLRCSSREINEFVEFVKRQPYADNTEIVIVGDHLFKGNLVVKKFAGERNWLTIFINPVSSASLNSHRYFASIDIAPTILESLGMKLPNNKMAFGTSLWSSKRTLLETVGYDSLKHAFENLSNSWEYNDLIILKK